MLLGQIEFGPGDTIDLRDDGVWVSEGRPATCDLLNTIQQGSFGEENGEPGFHQTRQANDMMGGEIKILGGKKYDKSNV